MKKTLSIILLLAVVIGGIWYFAAGKAGLQGGQGMPGGSDAQKADSAESGGAAGGVNNTGAMTGPMSTMDGEELGDDEDDGYIEEDERPASEVYKSAEEALKAVKDGAKDYNDIILEQFTNPGDDCTWCDSFYKSVREIAMAPDTSEDEKSYFSELLAISGKPENIASLVEAIKTAGDNEKGDIFAEALELAVGGDNIVNYLGEQLSTDNELLKESVIAAMTNQGTRHAAELLYNQTTQNGDADGYYSLGIGLGEFVPDESAMPYLHELAAKRDQYSHLAVKALLNSGLSGLKMVFDVLANSKDADFDKQMLKDAVDHVAYDEETESYLKTMIESSKNENVTAFAKQALDDINRADSPDVEEEMPAPQENPAAR